ncbi:MAG: ABC transporter ATP-binding protein [Pyrinomonadaceae bacterium]|nr:ABC transporter ATP-binding protein [Pyrinomonadaceae bacterium]
MKPIITVNNLSKQYRIGAREEGYTTLRESLVQAVRAPFKRIRSRRRNANNGMVWALKDINFEVQPGEVVGIVGPNGAGKSTLLKILSRITKPTTGAVDLYGRVRSLLEVGTGFHPELTGRENVYLNGAIMGMTRAEIEGKFEEIVAFAEVGKFLDTPVKRYSSGMNLRLAFAVAAHLEPEILIVDEVLAVGDAAFQEKCLGKMDKVAKEGRTVLFVSHNLATVQHLCNRAILLQGGRITATGQPSEVIGHYLSDATSESKVDISDWPDRETSGEARLVEFEIRDEIGQLAKGIRVGGSVVFTLRAEFYQPIVDPCFGVTVHNSLGEPILDLRSSHSGLRLGRVHRHLSITARIDNIGLYPGRYFLSPWITDARVVRNVDWAKLCCTLQIDPAPGPYGDLKLNLAYGKYWVQSNWMVNGSAKYS